MITQLFHQASVDLEGLEELIENSALNTQGSLIDRKSLDVENSAPLVCRTGMFAVIWMGYLLQQCLVFSKDFPFMG